MKVVFVGDFKKFDGWKNIKNSTPSPEDIVIELISDEPRIRINIPNSAWKDQNEMNRVIGVAMNNAGMHYEWVPSFFYVKDDCHYKMPNNTYVYPMGDHVDIFWDDRKKKTRSTTIDKDYHECTVRKTKW